MSKKEYPNKYEKVHKNLSILKNILNVIFSGIIIISGIILKNIILIVLGILLGCLGFYIVKRNKDNN